jgi:ABC-type transporter Mla subunit MlaD
MAEPENHTLRLLREFREEMGDFRADMREFQVQTDRALNKVTADISEIKDKLDTLTRAVAGEIVQSRYVSAAIDDRFAEIERRLSALEQSR